MDLSASINAPHIIIKVIKLSYWVGLELSSDESNPTINLEGRPSALISAETLFEVVTRESRDPASSK